MTAFIKQEATEKAREIEIKADEEFAIEKSKLVRQETDAIDTAYQKKFKQATMSQQITRSTVANKTRLRVLSARQEMLDGIFSDAEARLSEAAKDTARYEGVLKGLILEGFYAMNEPELQIRARARPTATSSPRPSRPPPPSTRRKSAPRSRRRLLTMTCRKRGKQQSERASEHPAKITHLDLTWSLLHKTKWVY